MYWHRRFVTHCHCLIGPLSPAEWTEQFELAIGIFLMTAVRLLPIFQVFANRIE